MPKDRIRFALAGDGAAPATLEVRIGPDRLGGWRANALMLRPGAPPEPLGRVFRARDRRLTADKMVAWVRRRYRDARPLADHAGRPPRPA